MRNLKTHPGGHRHLHRFDPRIRAFWQILANHADPETYMITVNVTRAGDTLGVHRHTIRRWLDWLEKYQLVSISDRQGGRGCGVEVEMTWLKRGVSLSKRKKRAIEYRRQALKKRETVLQRQKTLKDSKEKSKISRGRIMQTARLGINAKIKNKTAATQLINVVGQGVFKYKVPLDRQIHTLNVLLAAKHIPVPRWVKDPASAYRWALGLWFKLCEYGAAWWEKLAKWPRRAASRTPKRAQPASPQPSSRQRE